MPNSKQTAVTGNVTIPTNFEEQILDKLELIISRLDEYQDRLDAIDVRLSDLDLDSGTGYEID